MRLSVALFRALKKSWDAANLIEKFPGGYVAGERIKKPSAFPSLQPWPAGESGGMKTNKGQINDVSFEVAIVARTFEECGDELLTKALEDATSATTASGPLSLPNGIRLVAIMPVADSARYAEFEPDLFVCFVTFNAKLSY